ncbi:hypothetical protein UPM260_1743 [Salmonella enterica subsp. enterica serovar Typhimurium]|nr:hypothetical protein UPM260_1743 [Salmonella enterica subsp. enterica serovar Typhimurium]
MSIPELHFNEASFETRNRKKGHIHSRITFSYVKLTIYLNYDTNVSDG